MTDHWRLTQALTALHAARQSALEIDPDMPADAFGLSPELAPELETVEAAIRSTIASAIAADAMATQAGEILARVTARRDRYKARAERLRSAAFAAMDAIGAGKMEWPEMTLSIAAGRASAVVTDVDALPDAFVTVERKPKKDAIANELKAGRDVPGAELRNGMQTLTVRTK